MSAAEERARRSRFEAFLHEAARLAEANPHARYGVTEFADELPEERAARVVPLSARRSPPPLVEQQEQQRQAAPPKPNTRWSGECVSCKRFPQLSKAQPSSWDWVEHGAVTSVKAQGGCGGCYAFAAAGAVEGAWYLSGQPLTSLSVEQIVSCDRVRSDGGCGGSVTNLDTFQYVIEHGGLAAYDAYPFSNASLHDKPPRCDAAKAAKTVGRITDEWRISGYGHLNDTYPGLNETFPGKDAPWAINAADNAVNESRVIEALVRVGPLSIAINAGRMDSYKGGVDVPPTATQCPYFCCYPAGNSYSLLDHVLLVGFGEEDGVKFWKIKNSWGPKWGEGGYFRVARGMNSVGVACDVIGVAQLGKAE